MKLIKYLAVICVCIVTFFALFVLVMSNETILSQVKEWFPSDTGVSSVEQQQQGNSPTSSDLPSTTEPPDENQLSETLEEPNSQKPILSDDESLSYTILNGRAFVEAVEDRLTVTISESDLNSVVMENLSYMAPLTALTVNLNGDGSIGVTGAVSSAVLKEHVSGFMGDMLLALLPTEASFSATGTVLVENGDVLLSFTSVSIANLSVPQESIGMFSGELENILNRNLEMFLEKYAILESVEVTEGQIRLIGRTIS